MEDAVQRQEMPCVLLNLVIILHYQCNNNWPLVAGITYFYFNTLVAHGKDKPKVSIPHQWMLSDPSQQRKGFGSCDDQRLKSII